MKTGYNKGIIDQLNKFLDSKIESPAELNHWSMQVSAFLKTELGVDEADNFLNLKSLNDYDEYALRIAHLQGLIARAEAEERKTKRSNLE